MTDDFIERARLRIQLSEQGLNYRFAHDRLTTYPMSSRERKRLSVLTKKTRKASALNDAVAEIMLSDSSQRIIKKALIQAGIARQNLMTGLNQLIALQDDNTRRILHENHHYQNTITNIIILLSAAAFFIALLIALVVIRETSKQSIEIRYRASHDELTGLVNRKEFSISYMMLLNSYASAIPDMPCVCWILMNLKKSMIAAGIRRETCY